MYEYTIAPSISSASNAGENPRFRIIWARGLSARGRQIPSGSEPPAQACIALEDSEIGLRASRGAGLRTFITHNAYTARQDFAGAAAVFPDLADLDAFLNTAGLVLPA